MSALSEGFAIFSKQMRSAQTKENTEVSSRPPAVAIVRPRRPDTSPMPNRVLDFGESNVNNDEIVPIPAKSEPEYKHDATESIRSKSVNTGSAAAAHNKCAFCGKPSSKSALSAHLLVCKSRKEMQMKRQASIQNDAASRGNVSAGKSRVAIIHRKINSGGTPKREARKSVTSAPAKEQIESDRQTTRIWGSLTPDDMTLGERLLQTSNRENRNDFISPAGVGDGINSAGRPAVGVVKNAALSIARKPHYSSPVKGVTRSNSAQRSHVKALGEHQSNIETPNRAITTRVFM